MSEVVMVESESVIGDPSKDMDEWINYRSSNLLESPIEDPNEYMPNPIVEEP